MCLEGAQICFGWEKREPKHRNILLLGQPLREAKVGCLCVCVCPCVCVILQSRVVKVWQLPPEKFEHCGSKRRFHPPPFSPKREDTRSHSLSHTNTNSIQQESLYMLDPWSRLIFFLVIKSILHFLSIKSEKLCRPIYLKKSIQKYYYLFLIQYEK